MHSCEFYKPQQSQHFTPSHCSQSTIAGALRHPNQNLLAAYAACFEYIPIKLDHPPEVSAGFHQFRPYDSNFTNASQINTLTVNIMHDANIHDSL